jgi:hypothetical protein
MNAITTDESEADGLPLEELHVQAWRREQLLRLGLGRRSAEIWADLVDWHDVEALIEQGCPAEIALRILR